MSLGVWSALGCAVCVCDPVSKWQCLGVLSVWVPQRVCVGSAYVQASPCLYWVPVFPLCPMVVLEEGVGVSGCGLGILQPLARLAKRFC